MYRDTVHLLPAHFDTLRYSVTVEPRQTTFRQMALILAIFLAVLNFLCFFLCFKTKKEDYIILHQIKLPV
ncbi:MAG: hypothetical protein K6T34_10190, partial [Thermoflavifilum sp.]|nr:hypothetical protein [Thermoflavifilum sp.]